jgi:hypothetical protein
LFFAVAADDDADFHAMLFTALITAVLWRRAHPRYATVNARFDSA